MSLTLTEARVGYKDLRGYLALLEEAGLLLRIKAPVDLKGEIGAISSVALDRREPPALVFENIVGYQGMPLVSNILNSTQKLAIAFNCEPDDMEVLAAIHSGKVSPIAPRIVESAACQEEVHFGDDVDLYMFPTPWWHEGDGGPYIGTTAGFITADPDTGYLNCGMYRLMIVDRNTFTAHIKGGRGGHPVGEPPEEAGRRFPGSQVHILKNEARGRPTPVAVAIAMDPLLTYAAGQEVPSDTLQHAEFSIAGAWRGEPVELVKCKTNDLLIPAWSEIVLEGEALLNERRVEGPHGESAGFYHSSPNNFVIKVNCITHRKNPINYGLVCRPLEDYPAFLEGVGLRKQLMALGIDVRDVYSPEWATNRIAIVAAKIEGRDDVEKLIAAADQVPWEKHISRKPRWLVIVDDDCDVRNWDDVIWRFIGVRLDKDVRIRPGKLPTDFMEDWSMVIDATRRGKTSVRWGPSSTGEEEFPMPSAPSREMSDRVQRRWREYGFGS